MPKASEMLSATDLLDLAILPRPLRQVVARRRNAELHWEEFLGKVQTWRHWLAGAGNSFALFMEDSVEFAAALFGAWQAEKTIYVPGDNLPGTCAALSRAVDGFVGNFAAEWSPACFPPAHADDTALEFRALNPEFAGVVLFTSGTTGAAQPIRKKIGQLAREVATLERQFGARLGSAEIFSTVSHQHIYGLLFQVLWPLTVGRVFQAHTCEFLEELFPALDERECVLVSSPAHLKRLPEERGLIKKSNRLRAVFSSGGPLPLANAQEAARVLGSVPIEVYGSSETGGIAWRRQDYPDSERWTPFDGVGWRIESDSGVLAIRSPHLPDDGWFITADRAEPTGEGSFRLTGRIDRIAKIEGKRISLNAIEAQLKMSALVEEARVIALEEERQKVAAFVVLSECGRQSLSDEGRLSVSRQLRDLVRQRVEAAGVPRIWRYIESLPVNAQGKATHAELLTLLGRKHGAATKPRYRLLVRESERAVLELIAPHDLVYFQGHFPTRPILAGVVQIDWVIAFGRRYFDLPPQFRAIHALKFQRVIRPELPLRLELLHQPAKRSLSFTITSETGSHASGRIIFGACDV